MSFAENLRKYRERAGYSSKELANIIKIKYTTYLNYENAGSEPRYEILMKIADILNVSIDDLLGRTLTIDKVLFTLDSLGFNPIYVDRIKGYNVNIALKPIQLDENSIYFDQSIFTEAELLAVYSYAVSLTEKNIENTREQLLSSSIEKAFNFLDKRKDNHLIDFDDTIGKLKPIKTDTAGVNMLLGKKDIQK